MQYTTAYSENIYSFVNNINTIEGGTHLEGFKRALTKVFNDYAKSHNILKEKDGNLQGEDIREGITAVISVKVKEPQFEGQTKTKLGNSEVTGIVQELVNEKLYQIFRRKSNGCKSNIRKMYKCIKSKRSSKKSKRISKKKKCSRNINITWKISRL